jgi:hypothetical protein
MVWMDRIDLTDLYNLREVYCGLYNTAAAPPRYSLRHDSIASIRHTCI